MATIALLSITACGTPMSSPPERIVSFCKGSSKPDVSAMRRVAFALQDGTQYKSPGGPFEYRALPELQNWGGAVGYWSAVNFTARRTVAGARASGWEPFALAIPDRGTQKERDEHRLVSMGFRSFRTHREAWVTQSSRDGENICK